MKILFIIKKRISYFGTKEISFGLINSAKFVAEVLDGFEDVESKIVSVVDNNCIDKEVSEYKPDLVIIEALWVVPEKFNVLIKLHPTVKWIIRMHSKPSFLANEGIAFPWINKYVEIEKETGKLFLSTNNEEFAFYLSKLYQIKCLYSPNIYPDVEREIKLKIPDKNVFHIGCFGSIRPMKNHLSQALAAIEFSRGLGKELYFHVNSDRVEQHGDNVLKNLIALFKEQDDCNLVLHPWLCHSDFLDLVSEMDLGMQVSLSETYNIVAADFISLNIPILVSKEIDWAPYIYRANPNSLESMKQGLRRLYYLNSKFLTQWAKNNLKKSNAKAIKAWKKFLEVK